MDNSHHARQSLITRKKPSIENPTSLFLFFTHFISFFQSSIGCRGNFSYFIDFFFIISINWYEQYHEIIFHQCEIKLKLISYLIWWCPSFMILSTKRSHYLPFTRNRVKICHQLMHANKSNIWLAYENTWLFYENNFSYDK